MYSISAVRSGYLTLRFFKMILLFTRKIYQYKTELNKRYKYYDIDKMINLFCLTKLQK